MYVSVKRVFLDRASYAGTSASEAPLYHHKNVVAFPQSPEAALRAVSMHPSELAKTLMVQFVGEGHEQLRRELELSVSVSSLRDASRWLSCNSWPYIEATKQQGTLVGDQLDPSLEDLAQAYAVRVGVRSWSLQHKLIRGACP